MIDFRGIGSCKGYYTLLLAVLEVWLESDIEFESEKEKCKLSWSHDCFQFIRTHRSQHRFYEVRFRRNRVTNYGTLEVYYYRKEKVLWSLCRSKSSYDVRDCMDFFNLLPVIPEQFLDAVVSDLALQGCLPILQEKYDKLVDKL